MKATVGESQRIKPGEEAQLPTVARHRNQWGKKATTPGQGFGYVFLYKDDKLTLFTYK